MRKERCAVALLVVMASPRRPPVFAQEQPPALPTTVTIEQVLKLLADRSPRTAADRASIAVMAADLASRQRRCRIRP